MKTAMYRDDAGTDHKCEVGAEGPPGHFTITIVETGAVRRGVPVVTDVGDYKEVIHDVSAA